MEKAIDTLISTYGLPGIIIAALLVALVWTAKGWQAAMQAQITQTEKFLDQKYKDSQDMLEVLRNLRSSIDVSVRTTETAMAVLKSKV